MNQYGMGALPSESIEALIAKMNAHPLFAGYPLNGDAAFQPSGIALPAGVSLMPVCPPVEDQLQYGTCTANSTVGIAELYLKSAGRFVPGTDDLSRMFNYWFAGVLDHTIGTDTGRTVRSSIAAAQTYGLCKESSEPYVGSEIAVVPSDASIAEAAVHKVSQFAYILPDPNQDFLVTTNAVKAALADGKPVSMGFRVFRWLFSIHGPMNTHYLQPGPLNPGDPKLDYVGNHDVVIVGYQDTSGGDGYFIVRNSWGTAWGDAGYWAMPYVLINNAFDLWVILGYDGVGNMEEPLLTPAAVADARAHLVKLGFGTLSTTGEFTFTLDPIVYQAATAAYLKKLGESPKQMAQVVGLLPSDINNFLAAPANIPYLNAWFEVLK